MKPHAVISGLLLALLVPLASGAVPQPLPSDRPGSPRKRYPILTDPLVQEPRSSDPPALAQRTVPRARGYHPYEQDPERHDRKDTAHWEAGEFDYTDAEGRIVRTSPRVVKVISSTDLDELDKAMFWGRFRPIDVPRPSQISDPTITQSSEDGVEDGGPSGGDDDDDDDDDRHDGREPEDDGEESGSEAEGPHDTAGVASANAHEEPTDVGKEAARLFRLLCNLL